MTHIELAKHLHHKLYSERSTIDEAYEYAWLVAKGTDNPGAVMTAVQVVVNTICNELLKKEQLS